MPMDIAQEPYDTEGVPAQRVPPHAYFVVSAVFHYLGPSFAVLLFARVEVLGVAWLRIASAALIFAAWRRPWRAFARPRSRRPPSAAGLGVRPRADELLLLPRDQPAAARRRSRRSSSCRSSASRRSERARRRNLAALALAVVGRLPGDRRPARRRAARRGVRVRQRRPLRALHRACRSRRQAVRARAASTGSRPRC